MVKPSQIEAAFKAYDMVRKARAQAIADASRLTRHIMAGLEEDVGTDTDKLKEALGARWGFIYEFDINKHKK